MMLVRMVTRFFVFHLKFLSFPRNVYYNYNLSSCETIRFDSSLPLKYSRVTFKRYLSNLKILDIEVRLNRKYKLYNDKMQEDRKEKLSSEL